MWLSRMLSRTDLIFLYFFFPLSICKLFRTNCLTIESSSQSTSSSPALSLHMYTLKCIYNNKWGNEILTLLIKALHQSPEMRWLYLYISRVSIRKSWNGVNKLNLYLQCETNFYSFGKVRLTDLGFLYDGKDNAKETGNAKHFDSSVFHLHLFFWGMFLMLP